jgi:hypothetical protein
LIFQGAAQKMAQLTQILSEKDEQLSKMRNASETESAAKSRELEEIASKIPGLNNNNKLIKYVTLKIWRITVSSLFFP